MNTFTKTLLGTAVGALLGASGVWLLGNPDEGDMTATGGERKPLYWVAPMDPNYKRDKPGKSPMGMDLIPVYEKSAGEDEAGTVKISPEVVNNLGVRTATVGSGSLNLDVKTVGYVQYDENRLVHISPRVEGWIETLHVKAAGDPVRQGDPLYALYSPTLVNAQEELLLALKRDNPVLIGAAVERLLALQVPRADIDRLRKTRKVSQTITVAAPQSGVLDNLAVREGMFVKPGLSLMSIGQLEHIWVIGEVFERQASLVKTGDQVRMRLDYLPGRDWLGQVDYVYPSLNAKTRTAQIRVHFDNPDDFLKPGMFAQMVIETQAGAEALLIPREALIRTGSQARVVLALGDGKFKSVAVEVGRVGERQVEIQSGLKEGERIVTSAQFLIDSESSKTSDFKRMAKRDQQGESMDVKADADSRSVWVAARIDSLMPDHRMVTLEHEAIPDWQWPTMTMDFTVAEAVDMDALKQGMRLHVQITNNNSGGYQITQVHIPNEQGNDAMPAGMDHGQHEGMDHGDMSMPEHSEHQGMNHDAHDQKEHNHD
ncbi:MAG: efflux transporter periplasmic adaptor subunit [Alcanivorax sp.]|jgi:Cu(I)/Ag(I) efflux system membrane fusion protein|uniref:efflux RND transporter periplasmic adaptor subunit n=1 Tax=Alcanivorax sp. TaxID=1872427 RepID=UPI000C8F43B9|nr:efflux RND transporter periplasmic adaptor subunit [Alcanivorax sp.]MAC13560.1 efflux transporter periplasmic adaptor subunit [Alcanivorax sp.]|tara:strand:- start:502 stop:2127 length:1626 start_codon:yes stop_codon:yes gene_type:complete